MAGSGARRAIHIVWFKRDLRVEDHRPLALASARGPVMPLYVVEPDLWRQPDAALRHWAFIAECLNELRHDLARLGQPLVMRFGAVPDVLSDLAAQFQIDGLWSHQETGNGWSFQRDKAVKAWARSHGVVWSEIPQHGVIRGLSNRDGWARAWDRQMGEPITPALDALTPLSAHPDCGDHVDPGAIPTSAELADRLNLARDDCPDRQPGGRAAGRDLLRSFLHERGRDYRREMSSPLEGAHSCSRLSPHLAFGTLSMREIAQTTWARQRALKHEAGELGVEQKERKAAISAWRGSMVSFTGRLHWHCHFMQKLESEPRLEFQELHRHYIGLRHGANMVDVAGHAAAGLAQADTDHPPERHPAERLSAATRLEAYCAGETGFPFVDACLRSLAATGWINFRMRAMLMAFASYHLWLHWRNSGLHLARVFTDYEPGIHWSQSQMQSGTTGINTPRIYNPVKQGHDQDPEGQFVRTWVPELAALPGGAIHEPWRNDAGRALLGRVYPDRIVDHEAAARHARTAIWQVRRTEGYRDEANRIQERHGSRKSGVANRGQRGTARRPSGASSRGRAAASGGSAAGRPTARTAKAKRIDASAPGDQFSLDIE